MLPTLDVDFSGRVNLDVAVLDPDAAPPVFLDTDLG
jgi:hypothetical protein